MGNVEFNRVEDYYRDDEPDPVNRPPHYTRGTIEVWDFIIDQRMDYCTGCVVKYLARAGHKGDKLTDLKKARAYLDKLIQCEEQHHA